MNHNDKELIKKAFYLVLVMIVLVSFSAGNVSATCPEGLVRLKAEADGGNVPGTYSSCQTETCESNIWMSGPLVSDTCIDGNTLTEYYYSTGVACLSTNTDCNTGYACVSGACKTSCSSDTDCDTGYYCRSSTSTCVDGNEGSNCDDTNDCDGWCYTGTTVSALTDTCVASNHCASSTIGTYGTVGNVVCAGNDVWKCYGETGGTSDEGWGLYSDCTNNQCYDVCSGTEGSGTAACTYQANGADPANYCTASAKVCDADKCGWTRSNDGACAGGSNTCGSDSGNTSSYKVCGAGGADTDASSTSTSCDSSVDYYASDYACTYSRRYAECNGAGTCDTTSTTYYQGSTLNTPASKVSKSQSGGSSTPYQDATSSNKCGITDVCSDNACSGTIRYLECGGTGSCSTSYYTSTTVYASANNVLNTGCGNDAASTTNYCSYSETCDDGDCSANKYYYGCVGASASCGGSSPYTLTVYPSTGYTLTNTCTSSTATACSTNAYTDYQCSGASCGNDAQVNYADAYCGATHTCNYQGAWKGWSTLADCSVYEKCVDGTPSSCYNPVSTYNSDISSTDDPAIRDNTNLQCHSYSVTNECGYNNIERLLMLVNYGTANNHPNPYRGYFGWYAGYGYTADPQEQGGATSYGNDYVTLDSSSSTVASGSASGGSGTVTLTSCYSLHTDYGAYDNNDVSYYWSDNYGTATGTNDYNSGWKWPTAEGQRFDTVECDSDDDCLTSEYCSANVCTSCPSDTCGTSGDDRVNGGTDCTDAQWADYDTAGNCALSCSSNRGDQDSDGEVEGCYNSQLVEVHLKNPSSTYTYKGYPSFYMYWANYYYQEAWYVDATTHADVAQITTPLSSGSSDVKVSACQDDNLKTGCTLDTTEGCSGVLKSWGTAETDAASWVYLYDDDVDNCDAANPLYGRLYGPVASSNDIRIGLYYMIGIGHGTKNQYCINYTTTTGLNSPELCVEIFQDWIDSTDDYDESNGVLSGNTISWGGATTDRYDGDYPTDNYLEQECRLYTLDYYHSVTSDAGPSIAIRPHSTWQDTWALYRVLFGISSSESAGQHDTALTIDIPSTCYLRDMDNNDAYSVYVPECGWYSGLNGNTGTFYCDAGTWTTTPCTLGDTCSSFTIDGQYGATLTLNNSVNAGGDYSDELYFYLECPSGLAFGNSSDPITFTANNQDYFWYNVKSIPGSSYETILLDSTYEANVDLTGTNNNEFSCAVDTNGFCGKAKVFSAFYNYPQIYGTHAGTAVWVDNISMSSLSIGGSANTLTPSLTSNYCSLDTRNIDITCELNDATPDTSGDYCQYSGVPGSSKSCNINSPTCLGTTNTLYCTVADSTYSGIYNSNPIFTTFNPDSAQSYCDACQGSSNWALGGETASTDCCGDDASENKVVNSYSETMDATGDASDACCTLTTDCVDANTCYDTGFLTNDADSDGDNDYCINSEWRDCSTSTQCAANHNCEYNDCIHQRRISFKDSSQNDVAIFDASGGVFLKGSLYENTLTSPGGSGTYVIKDSLATEQAWIDSTGNLYLKGTVFENQGSLVPNGGDWIVKDDVGDVVAYIEGTNGNLYIAGTVAQGIIS